MPSANTLNKDEVKSSGGLLAGLIGEAQLVKDKMQVRAIIKTCQM